jgi:ferredoxin-NADP reductase/predicted pyridoxine 5'-phosphate oxidase superfamily flavin-nucleotide-binding protein
MGRAYSDITFTPAVREIQARMGSRAMYAGFDQDSNRHDRLSRREIAFVKEADHFFQATVSETGWPYVQHRGGPAGFLKVLDNKTLGFTDFTGNVQYITVGNLKKDDRISLILVDYANQARLKIIGRARTVEAADDPELIERVRNPGYDGRIERAFIITVEGYDWNCPQHITPRFTEAEIAAMTAPLHAQLRRLKEQLAQSLVRPPAAELGSGPLALVVSGVRQLTPRVRSYELRSADGAALPAVRAGAHIEVPVTLPDGAVGVRNYSIASDPQRSDAYEIAVLREDEGKGGSAGVHEEFRLGLLLHCGLPRNDFELEAGEGPVLLVAGGIGITPIKAMAHTLLAQGREFELHYAVRSRAQAPFLAQLQAEFGARLFLYPADEAGRIDLDQVMAAAGADAMVYACGPARMIAGVRDSARRAGIGDERVRFERFASDAARGDDQPVFVTLKRSGKTVEVAAGTSILDAVQEAGVAAPASCRIGTCGTCAVKVLDGVPDHRDDALSDAERNDGKLMCICVSRAASPALTLDL